VLVALGVLAFTGLVDGLGFESLLLGPWPGRRTEYGPAVAGLAASSGFGAGRNFVGRIGATESPPCATIVDSGRGRTGPSEAVEIVEEFDTVRSTFTGEK
jgi:hypothetical protein